MGHDMRSRTFGRVRKYATLGAGVALIGGLGFTQAAGATPSATSALSNSRPAFTAQAKDLGAVRASEQVDFEVLLSLPNESAVEAEVQALSTPGNPSFRHFLTPAQFRSTYAPSAASVAAVEAWVRRAGLKVASVAPSRLYVEVTGTMAHAESLVGTTLDRYAYHGQDLAEPVSNYNIPTALSGVVAGVVNLDDASLMQKPTTDTGSATTASSSKATPDGTLPGPPPGVHYGIQPCSAYYGEKIATDKPAAYGQNWPYTICGYNADQYEQAFGLYNGIQSGTNGSGVTVAITDAYASPTMLSDADTWSTQNDLPTFASGQYTQVTPKADKYNKEKLCGPQGWYGEETLDVESVHAMAPGANVVFVGAKNCAGGLDLAWASTIDNHLASVVTDSWNDNTEVVPAGLVDFYQEYLLEAGTTGMTVMFSSGDDGDEVASTGTKQVSLPDSDPYATAVGGTSTEIGQDGTIVFQAGWSSYYSSISKSGTSWTPEAAGGVLQRCRWWHEHSLRPALLPGRCRPGQDLQVQREDSDAGRARRGHAGRPRHGPGDRRDPAILGRDLLRHLPPGRDEPVVTPLRRGGGRRRAIQRLGYRVHQPASLREHRHLGHHRCHGSELSGSNGSDQPDESGRCVEPPHVGPADH